MPTVARLGQHRTAERIRALIEANPLTDVADQRGDMHPTVRLERLVVRVCGARSVVGERDQVPVRDLLRMGWRDDRSDGLGHAASSTHIHHAFGLPPRSWSAELDQTSVTRSLCAASIVVSSAAANSYGDAA